MPEVMDGYIVDYVSQMQVRSTPEEIEAVQPFAKKLVEDYGYPIQNIMTHPQHRVKVRPSDVKKEYPVDIAVFSDSSHAEDNCYLIVECKKKNRKDGKGQLEDYLRFSKACLGVWYNGKETLYIRKYEKDGSVHFVEIPNIPIYGQRVEDVGLFKRRDLKKTHNLKSVFGSIRNYLAANNTGITLDNEFVVQLINIIFCKIYDERFTRSDDIVNFRAGIEEPSKDISLRVKKIFDAVKNKYPDVFSKSDTLSLTDSSIAYIVGELQQYCLIESERDVIADAFEMFISPSLRGGQGQFFTPRNVVKLLVSLSNPTRNDKLIEKTLSTLIQTNETKKSTQIDAFFESKPKIDAFLKIDANAQRQEYKMASLHQRFWKQDAVFFSSHYFFVFGAGNSSYTAVSSCVRKSLLSTLSTSSISFAPS